MKQLVIIIGFLSIVFSCSDDDIRYDQSIEGSWTIDYLIDRSDLYLVSAPILVIEGPAGFSGIAVCNSYFGLIENLTENEINFGLVFSTEIACGNALNIEFSYYDNLKYVKYYEISSDDKLIFYDENRNLLMEFNRT